MEHGNSLDRATYTALADTYGTPLFVYDGAAVLDALSTLRAALPAPMEIFYSLKANPNISVVGLLAGAGARAEVCSLVELRIAVTAGVDPAHIIFLGPGKSDAELRACVALGIYAVVVESFAELAELDRIAAQTGRRQRVLLRVNPGDGRPGGALTMGGKARQFGIDEAQLLAAGPLAGRYPALDLCGVHIYVGTRILDADVLVENTARNLLLAERIATATQIRLDAVDVGGGLGVAYFAGESDPDVARLREPLGRVVDAFLARHPGTRLLFEAGRFLVARSGAYLIRVRYVKQSAGAHFAVADGGTNQHQAAGGIGSYVQRNFPVALVNRTADETEGTGPWQVTGPLCTPNDTVAKNVVLPPLRPGDLLSIGRAGAYGPTASPGLFLGHGFAAEVLLHSGRPYLVRRRDTPVDLLHQQRYHHFGSQPMERRQAFEQIRLIVSHVVHRELPELSEDTPLAALGLDSTGMLEMLMELEDSGAVEIDADELDPHVFVTVGSLADYITRMAKVP